MEVREASAIYSITTEQAGEAVPPGYKRTEVGVIPEDWDVSTFGEQFSISAGGDVNQKLSSLVQDGREH